MRITARVTGVIEPALAEAEQQRVLRELPERLDAWEAYSAASGPSTNTDRRRIGSWARASVTAHARPGYPGGVYGRKFR
jgi:hypothetical protein